MPTSLTDFVSVINELFELQNKVSILNMLFYLYELTVTAKVGADLFNFGLTVYSIRLSWSGPSVPMRTGHINCSVPKCNISSHLEEQTINLLREGQAGGGGGGGKATWP